MRLTQQPLALSALILTIGLCSSPLRGQSPLSPGDMGFVVPSYSTMYTTTAGSGVASPNNVGAFGGLSYSCLWHPGYPDSFYVSGGGTTAGFVGHVDFSTSGVSAYSIIIVTGTGNVWDMSTDANGQIIIGTGDTGFTGSQVASLDPASGLLTPITSGTQPWGVSASALAVDPITGDCYIGSNNAIHVIPFGSTTPIPFASGWHAWNSIVSGIAFHPITGTLHATLQSVDRVVAIDSLGNMTDVIPPGTISGAGSLQFDPVTSDLLIVASSGSIPSQGTIWRVIGGVPSPEVSGGFSASLISGLAIVGAASPSVPTATPYGVGCGGTALSTTSVPSLGGSFPIDVTGATPGSLAYLFLALSPQAAGQPVGGSCNLYLDPVSLQQAISLGVSPLGPIPLPPSGTTTFTLTVPNDPAAAGAHVYLQGAVTDMASPIGVWLTNGLDALLN